MSTGRQVQIYIGLAPALVVSNLGLSKYGAQISSLGPRLGREAIWWALAVVVLLYVVLIEGKPLSSIGFRRITWKTFVFGLWAALCSARASRQLFLLFCRICTFKWTSMPRPSSFWLHLSGIAFFWSHARRSSRKFCSAAMPSNGSTN